MKSLVLLIAYLLWLKHLQSAPNSQVEESLLRKKIKVISKLGEAYVEQEIQKALTGVKQMKNIMEKNEEKHENILKSLTRTSEEKMEAISLLEDINERTNEAEAQCKERLLNIWDECEACRERSCISFYITNCSQQGFQSFSKDIYKEWSTLSLQYSNNEENKVTKNSDKMTAQLTQEESSFSLLVSDVGFLFNQSIAFFKNIKQKFDQSFQRLFMSDIELPDPDIQVTVPDNDSMIQYDILNNCNLSNWFQSFYDFGKAIFEGIISAISKMLNNHSEDSKSYSAPLQGSAILLPKIDQLCKELQNYSRCVHFQERCQLCNETLIKDCPDVLELYEKSEEAYKLVNMSSVQYNELIQLIQQHTENTSNLINQMKEKFGWVSELANLTAGTDNIFSIEKVFFSPKSAQTTFNETIVEVNIFTSPTFTVRVPGDLDLESTKFIQYVAEEALKYYKTNF